MSRPPIRAGLVLAAVPILKDPNFYRTVVLICDHNEEGTFGLVLNRETELAPEQILEDLGAVGSAVSVGGPVQPGTLHYLHDLGEAVPGAVELVPGLWWGGDFETFKDAVSAPDFEGAVRLFLGYSGWGSGQLEAELEEGAWAVAGMKARWAFHTEPEQIWRQVMLSLGGEWELLANFPEDPRMN